MQPHKKFQSWRCCSSKIDPVTVEEVVAVHCRKLQQYTERVAQVEPETHLLQLKGL